MNLCVIPARGGSKRIPRKNIKDFGGKPIIAWSIDAARRANCFDQIIVSTEDFEIAEVARAYGADVPFMRPPKLADDYTETGQVIAHAIDWTNRNTDLVRYACCLYATAPFVQSNDIRHGLHLLQQTKAEYAITVTEYGSPIQRAIRINNEQRIEMFHPEFFHSRSQDLEVAFHDAGQFYWGLSTSWLDGNALFSHGSVPLLLPRYRVQDIDTAEDWKRAEIMFRVLKNL